MKILAKTIKGKEFMYSRNGAVQIPESWNDAKVAAFINGINKHFKVAENETYHPYNIDQYDSVFPDYKATYRQGKAKLIRI
jgi:hypothetical protein